MSAAVTRAVQLGVKTIALPSAGNAAGAATYYASRRARVLPVHAPGYAAGQYHRICGRRRKSVSGQRPHQ